MAYQTVRPIDFSSDRPPERIIGIECEYNIQPGTTRDHKRFEHELYISRGAIREAGYNNHGPFLGNGAKLYKDGRQLEYATAEELGPLDAAAADLAGIDVISSIVAASKYPHNGLFRLSGTSLTNSEGSTETKSSGYHENYLLPRVVANGLFIARVMPSFLGTRLFSMSGMVLDKYVFSQKVWGIGGKPITHQYHRQTTHGDKPMVIMRDDDSDTVGNPDWTRMEVRFADAGRSPRGRLLTFGATSLVARMAEHPQYLPKDTLDFVELRSPVEAAKVFSQDLSLTKTQLTSEHNSVTMLDVSESLAAIAMHLTTVVDLPQDEVLAAQLWVEFNDAMRAANPSKCDYGDLVKQYDFAARHRRLRSALEPYEINNTNPAALKAQLLWDRTLPKGGGGKMWDIFTDKYVTPEKIAEAKDDAPNVTRASARGEVINDPESRFSVTSWSSYLDKKTNLKISQPDTYCTELPVARKQ